MMAIGAHAQALENIHRERMGRGSTASQYDEDIVPPVMKRAIAVYEAARVLMGFITPGYDEISQVPHESQHALHYSLAFIDLAPPEAHAHITASACAATADDCRSAGSYVDLCAARVGAGR